MQHTRKRQLEERRMGRLRRSRLQHEQSHQIRLDEWVRRRKRKKSEKDDFSPVAIAELFALSTCLFTWLKSRRVPLSLIFMKFLVTYFLA